jgi:ribonuclease Z
MRDIPDYHATPVEAAAVANAAGVRLLVLSHLVPPPPNAIARRIFARGVDAARDGDWWLGDDGLLVELPLATAEIAIRNLD